MSGLGVRPTLYSAKKYSKTLSQYSVAKLMVCNLIPNLSQTC